MADVGAPVAALSSGRKTLLVFMILDKVGAEAKGSKRDDENELVHVRFVATME